MRSGFIIILFISLFALITWASHYIGSNHLGGKDFAGSGSRWGSVSDWFSGVVGVSIGLAGSSIAIWLAYRVERLTIAQNQMANVQAWREAYIESGDISARAELARRAYENIQKIYTNLIEIEKIDKNFSKDRFYCDEEQNETGEDQQAALTEALARANKDAEPFQRDIHEAVAGLVGLLPDLKRRGAKLHDILGMTDAKAKEIAASYTRNATRGSELMHPMAQRILDRDPDTVHASDAVNFLMEFTRPHPRVMGQAAHQSVDFYPADFAEYLWEKNAESPGRALDPFSDYLPAAVIDNKADEKYVVQWVQALCDYILEEANPYKYAHETILHDLQVGEVNERQERRLAMLSHIAIKRVLPASHYIHELFPEGGFPVASRCKAVVDSKDSDYLDPEDKQPQRPKGNLERNKSIRKPHPKPVSWWTKLMQKVTQI